MKFGFSTIKKNVVKNQYIQFSAKADVTTCTAYAVPGLKINVNYRSCRNYKYYCVICEKNAANVGKCSQVNEGMKKFFSRVT